MRPPARAATTLLALALLLAACSSGSTEVQGVDGDTGSEATAPTAPTGPTAVTGPTGATGGTESFGGPVSLDIPAGKNPTGAAMYSCDGIEGTWTYDPGELAIEGLEFEMTADPVDMSGGEGTLVIEGTVTIAGGVTATFTDTVDLVIGGSPDAPEMSSSGVHVDVGGALEGVPFDFAQFFPENTSFAIVAGAPEC